MISWFCTIKSWKDAGFSKIQDLFLGGTLKSFSQLRTEFNLPQAQFFRYLQFRNYIQSIPIYKSGLYMNHLEKILLKAYSSRKKVYDKYMKVYMIKCLLISLLSVVKHPGGKILGPILMMWCGETNHQTSFETQYNINHRLYAKFDL